MNRLITIFILTFLLVPQALSNTSIEDRVYILSSVWRNVRDNFAFPNHFEQSHPDSLYKSFLPQVMNANSESEFSMLMTEFLAKFDDGHTRFFVNTHNATVPIRFIGLNNNVYVRNIGKQYIKRIPVGSKLVKINDQQVTDFLGDEIYPYVAASNDDWKFRKSLDTFLNGTQGSKVKLEFLTPKHKIEILTIDRVESQLLDSYEWGNPEDNRVAYVKKMPGNIAYMRMSTFKKPDDVNTIFKDNIALMRNSKGVIFDIRGNRGGSDECWNPVIFDYIAPADKDQNTAFIMKCRVANCAFQEFGNQIPQLKDYATETAMDVLRTSSYFSQIPDSLKIKSPVIILIDGYTGSAAENFAITMKNLGLAKLVGSHTVGVISHPCYYDLPNGYSYGLSTWAYFNPDGSSIIETGILPDVEIEYTIDDLINKNDPQLDKAIELICAFGK